MVRERLRRMAPFMLGLGLGTLAGPTVFRAIEALRLMLVGQRQPLWRYPADLQLHAEDVTFASPDGVTLRGWFIHRTGDDGRPAPAIVFIHGWPWNRCGNRAGATILPDRTVDFLGPAAAFSQAGFHVLLFDVRNHGVSDARPPVTFGVNEAHDVRGAVAMLRTRPDVDGERIGLIGYSMGANAALRAAPDCAPIRGIVAVQPTSASIFAPNAARDVLGPAGPALIRIGGLVHRAAGSPPFSAIAPTAWVHRLHDNDVLYVQGGGDRWGSLADVEAMVANTPRAHPLIVAPSSERYGGYLYVAEHTDEFIAFFRETLGCA
ncbi:MAG: alpha/beta fold hydrolase [Chloroflexi bacterium]|nr:alpha/beta fold hydrolase [Chloroflexota bacterium]